MDATWSRRTRCTPDAGLAHVEAVDKQCRTPALQLSSHAYLRCHVHRLLHRCCENPTIHHLAIRIVEGRKTIDHLENKNAQWPPIHAHSVRLARNHPTSLRSFGESREPNTREYRKENGPYRPRSPSSITRSLLCEYDHHYREEGSLASGPCRWSCCRATARFQGQSQLHRILLDSITSTNADTQTSEKRPIDK